MWPWGSNWEWTITRLLEKQMSARLIFNWLIFVLGGLERLKCAILCSGAWFPIGCTQRFKTCHLFGAESSNTALLWKRVRRCTVWRDFPFGDFIHYRHSAGCRLPVPTSSQWLIFASSHHRFHSSGCTQSALPKPP